MASKIILLVLLAGLVFSAKCEESTKNITSEENETQNNVISKKSDGFNQKESPSLISKLTGWMFPFGGDSESSETHQGAQYLPPAPQTGGYARKECNPCNKEPWVPVVGKKSNRQPQTFGGQNFNLNQLQTYGPPPPAQQSYGAPPPQQNYGPPPQQNYGPPPPRENYGPPQTNFISPQESHGSYRQQHSIDLFQDLHAPAPPLQLPQQGPPQQIFRPQNYGPPPKLHFPQPTYGPPKPIQFKPQGAHRPKQLFGMPPPKYLKYAAPMGMKPPPLLQHNFGLPSSYEPPPSGIPINYMPPKIFQNYNPGPMSNYLPPSNFPAPPLTKQEYLPPQQQLPLANDPIPFPNLSTRPVAPIHNPQPFHQEDNYPQPGLKIEVQTNQDDSGVQIIKSIPVVDFLASIEHPINVIRSPLLEVDVANTSSHSDFNDEYRNNNYNNDKFTHQSNFNGKTVPNNFDFTNFNNFNPNEDYRNNNYKVSTNYKDNFRDNGEYKGSVNYNNGFDNSGNNQYSNVENNYKLADNPIVVEDTHVAASTYNGTYPIDVKVNKSITIGDFKNLPGGEISTDFINQILSGYDGNKPVTTDSYDDKSQFTQPDVDYSSWSPNDIATSMIPPPRGESYWSTTYSENGRIIDPTTKKPKQIQIIIPYTTNTNPTYDHNQGRRVPPKNLPIYTQPPTIESVWTEHTRNDLINEAESQEVTVSTKPSTEVINIKDLFKRGNEKDLKYDNLPFDIIRFQKNIDGWTEQEYAKKMLQLQSTSTTRQVQSKNIPNEFLTTLPFNTTEIDSTTITPTEFFDHETAGTNSKEYQYKEEINSNLITESTTKKPNWDKIQISVSPLTKEKVYVVTPLPKSNVTSWNASSKFSISIMPMKNKTDSDDVKVVLSEWPHLINNLVTTTSTQKPPRTTRHPLFGLMDLAAYVPPANATIETYSGHSKVINAATSTKKKSSGLEDKKVAIVKPTPLKS